MNANPYKRMYLISEDEYLMRAVRTPEQQARLNSILLQVKKNVHAAEKLETDDDDGHVIVTKAKKIEDSTPCIGDDCAKGDETNKLLARQIQAHDEKYLREATKVKNTDDDDIEEKKMRWENIPIETARWEALPSNIRTRAHLLITLVHQYAKVNSQQEFQHNTRAVSGSNIFDLVRWAVTGTRAKSARKPTGWCEFLHFLSINKAIPRSILSKYTLEEIEAIEQNRGTGKRAQIPVVTSSFFESLYPKDTKRK